MMLVVKEIPINVTCGVGQCCMGSKIILKLKTSSKQIWKIKYRFQHHRFNVTSLFFADDGMLLARNVKLSEIIQVVIEINQCLLDMRLPRRS